MFAYQLQDDKTRNYIILMQNYINIRISSANYTLYELNVRIAANVCNFVTPEERRERQKRIERKKKNEDGGGKDRKQRNENGSPL